MENPQANIETSVARGRDEFPRRLLSHALFQVKCRIFEKMFRILIYHLPLRETRILAG